MSTSDARSTGWVGFLTAVGALLIAACGSGPRLHHEHEFFLSPGQEHHAGLATALLLPLDSTNEEPVKGLDIANDRIEALIVRHLESKGITIERTERRTLLEIRDAAQARILEARAKGASGATSAKLEFVDLVPEILARLEISPELIIAADLVMRSAAYQGTRTIAWDGVRRRETITEGGLSGSIPAASLRAAVYTSDGTRVFVGFGGLEPTFRIDRPHAKYVPRDDLFEDERNLREGICIAFHPYFGMGEYCGR